MRTEKIYKRRLAWIIAILSALSFLAFLLLTSIEWNTFDRGFYQKEYQKLNTAENIGMSAQDLRHTTEELLSYLEGERDDLNIRADINGRERQVFNQREITHMVDVKRLFEAGQLLRILCLIIAAGLFALVYLLLRRRSWSVAVKGYLMGIGVFIILSGILGAVIATNFTYFWQNMHYILFTNDLWILNPETDILIQMVPEQFFFDLVVRILITFVLSVMIIAGICIFTQKYLQKGVMNDV